MQRTLCSTVLLLLVYCATCQIMQLHAWLAYQPGFNRTMRFARMSQGHASQQLEHSILLPRPALHCSCWLQLEHKELLNRTHTGARCSGAGDSSDCRQTIPSSIPRPCGNTGLHTPGSSGSDSTPPGALTACSGTAQIAADPAAALYRMHNNLQALRVRKQRVTGGTPLSDLQQQAESASERLLLAKLQEAGRIMEEQETVSGS